MRHPEIERMMDAARHLSHRFSDVGKWLMEYAHTLPGYKVWLDRNLAWFGRPAKSINPRRRYKAARKKYRKSRRRTKQ